MNRLDASGVAALVERFEVSWPLKAFDVCLSARVDSQPGGTSVVVCVNARPPHRDTGKPGPAGMMSRLGVDVHLPESFVTEWLRRLLRDWVLHELDESIRLDGKRPFDPHAAENKDPGTGGGGSAEAPGANA